MARCNICFVAQVKAPTKWTRLGRDSLPCGGELEDFESGILALVMKLRMGSLIVVIGIADVYRESLGRFLCPCWIWMKLACRGFRFCLMIEGYQVLEGWLCEIKSTDKSDKKAHIVLNENRG